MKCLMKLFAISLLFTVYGSSILAMNEQVPQEHVAEPDSNEWVDVTFSQALVGHLEPLRELLKSGADANHMAVAMNLPLLMIAVHERKKDVVDLLIEFGADVNLEYRGVQAALFSENSEMIEHLVRAGADLKCFSHLTPLLMAVLRNKKDTVIALLKAGENIDLGYISPLGIAVQHGNMGMVKLLIEKGAHVDSLNIQGVTPLIIASQNGHIEIVNFLIAQGANVNAQAAGGRKCTALFQAAQCGHEQIVRMLLNSGAEINKTDIDGDTALMVASRNGHLGTVMSLLARRARVNIQGKSPENFTALGFALLNNEVKIAVCLIQNGADANMAVAYGLPPLAIAAEKGQSVLVESLLAHGADVHFVNSQGATALALAARYNHPDCIQLLLKHCANVEQRALGASPLLYAIGSQNPQSVRLLLDHKAKLAKIAPHTMLTEACIHGNAEIVAQLLEYKADVNECNDFGNPPLLLACALNHEAVVLALLAKNANVNLVGQFGRTPLMSAVFNPNIFPHIIVRKPNLALADNQGTTALHKACAIQQMPVIKALLEQGANPNMLDQYGRSPLLMVCNNEYVRRIMNLKSKQDGKPPIWASDLRAQDCESINILLDYGADIDVQDNRGLTPLMYLVGCHFALNHQEVMQEFEIGGEPIDQVELFKDLDQAPMFRLLLNRGANRDLVNKEGQTVRNIAVQQGRVETVEILDAQDVWGVARLKLRATKAVLAKWANMDAQSVQNDLHSMPNELQVLFTSIAPKAIKNKIYQRPLQTKEIFSSVVSSKH